MKILRIESCFDCKYNDFFYDTNLGLGRFVCRHPDFVTDYRIYKIINRKIALKGKIPNWCPLENYTKNKV